MEWRICSKRGISQNMVEGSDYRETKPCHVCSSIRWLREPDANLSYQHLHFPDYVPIFYSLLKMLTFQFYLGKIFPIYEKD